MWIELQRRVCTVLPSLLMQETDWLNEVIDPVRSYANRQAEWGEIQCPSLRLLIQLPLFTSLSTPPPPSYSYPRNTQKNSCQWLIHIHTACLFFSQMNTFSVLFLRSGLTYYEPWVFLKYWGWLWNGMLFRHDIRTVWPSFYPVTTGGWN